MQCDTSDELNVRNAISRCITELGLPSVVVNSSSKKLENSRSVFRTFPPLDLTLSILNLNSRYSLSLVLPLIIHYLW